MKKSVILILISIILLLSPVEAFAVRTAYVDNLQPRAELNVTVEDLPRKVDIVIDSDNVSPTWTELETLVNENIVPMLEAEGIDYQIRYNKPESHLNEPLFWENAQYTSDGKFYYYSTNYNQWSIPLPEGVEIVGVSDQYALDQNGVLYEFVSSWGPGVGTSYTMREQGETDLVRLFQNRLGVDENGDLYRLRWYSRDPLVTKIDGISNVIFATQNNNQILAVDKDGVLWGQGTNLSNPYNNPDATQTGFHIISSANTGFGRVKEVAYISGTDSDENYTNAVFALTTTGEVYSWGSGHIGRTTNYWDNEPQKINVEAIKHLGIVHPEKSRSALVAESGNMYRIERDQVTRAASNIVMAYGVDRRLARDGTISVYSDMPNPHLNINAGNTHAFFFSRNQYSYLVGYGHSNGWPSVSIPAGERFKQMIGYIGDYNAGGGSVFVTESGKVYHVGTSMLTGNGNQYSGTRLYDEIDNVEQFFVVYENRTFAALLKNGKVFVKTRPAGEWYEHGLSGITKMSLSQSGSDGIRGLALDRNGIVYSVDTFGGTKVNIPVKAKDIAFANGINAVLDVDGDVWTWGYSSNLSAGHGSGGTSNPTKLTGVPKIRKLAKTDATYNEKNMMLVGEDGSLWAWGDNYYGQVTNARYSDPGQLQRYDRPVKNTRLSNVDEVAVGEMYILAKTKDGSVYGWGRVPGRTDYAPLKFQNLYNTPIQGYHGTVADRLDLMSWRPGAERYLIHVSDTIGSELRHNYYTYQVVSRLIPNKIKYIGMSYNNTADMLNLVSANDNNGKVVRLTTNLPLNFRHVGQYIIQKQAIDLKFVVGETSQDDIKRIESRLRSSLVPQIEQYGYELKISVTDGVRIPENRLYYLDGNRRIAYYDPLTNGTRRITDRSTEHAMIHQTGDLFYLESGTRNVYRYNSLFETETLFATLPDRPAMMAVSKDLKVWYPIGQSMYQYDPATGNKVEKGNSYYGFYELRPGADKDVVYSIHDGTNISIAYPIRSSTYLNSFVQGESGCITYSSGIFYTIGGNWPSFSKPVATAKGCDFIYAIDHSNQSDEIGYYSQGNRTPLVFGTMDVLTSTPIGDVYYRLNNKVHVVNYMTLERRELSQGNFNVIKYFFHNIETRRISRISLTEGLEQAAWRPGTDAYYVFMQDANIPGLTNIADQLRQDKASFVGFGTNTNKAQIENFVEEMGHGTYINNSNINTAISQLTTYILNNAGLPKYETNENKVVLEYMEDTGTYQSGNLIWDDGYNDLENDPKNEEHWIFYHDPDVYENPLGRIPEHGQLLTEPLKTLTKTGLYEVHYEVSDLPSEDSRFEEYIRWSEPARLDVYGHRRPIAEFTAKLTPSTSRGFYELSITDRSYDLDAESTPTRGIDQWVWRWKRFSDPDWTVGQPPSTINDSEIYLIALRVKDFDDAWSDDKIVILFGDTINNPPVARFTVTPVIINEEEYTIEDQSHDPDGDPIGLWHWRVDKEGIELYNDFVQPTAAILRSAAEENHLDPYGTYTITLRVQDRPLSGSPLWSAPYSQQFEIIKNEPPIPDFIWSPTLLYQGDTVQLRHNVDDPDKDTLKVRYQVTAPNGAITYYPSATTWYTLPQDRYKTNAFTMNNLIGGDYTITQTVTDDYATRTITKTMHVIPNRPPVPGFTWSPIVLWEGDTIQLRHAVSDPDNDTLQVRYRLTDPNGAVTYFPSSSSWYTVPPGNYNNNAFQLSNVIPGTYTILQTVTDNKAPAVTLSQSFEVFPLSVEGEVRHTEEWNNNRIEYNRKHTGTDDSPRPYSVFWAGEKFILIANTTDTGSTNPALNVKVFMDSYEVDLSPNHTRTVWNGELYDESFEKLKDGELTFVFRSTWQNGTVKYDTVDVTILNNWTDFFRIHRLK